MRLFQKKRVQLNHTRYFLLSQTKSRYDCTISLDVHLFEIVEKTSSVTDHHKKTATAVMVVVVLLQMLGKRVDSAGEKGYLYLGRACVAFVRSILLDDGKLFFFGHFIHLMFFYARTQQPAGE